jgi:hypothetical protein
MFHLSAVYDKVQSFVATVTMKQCVYCIYVVQQIVEEKLLFYLKLFISCLGSEYIYLHIAKLVFDSFKNLI